MLGSKKPKIPGTKKNETHNTSLPHNETIAKNETHPDNGTHHKNNGSKPHRMLETSENKSNRTFFGRDKKSPQPPKNLTLKHYNETNKPKEGDETRGPHVNKYDPLGGESKFKGGKPGNLTKCKKRYQ